MNRIAAQADLKFVWGILRRAGLDPTLVGGQAVMISNVTVRDPDDDVLLSDPAFLGSLVRATADLDFVISAESMPVATAALEAAGFVRTYPRSLRLMRTGIEVDLLEGESVEGSANAEVSDRSIAVSLPAGDRVETDVDGIALSIAGPATLVVLKACALADPTRGRSQADLSDIATLAIREFVAPTSASQRLRQWETTMTPELRGRLRSVRQKFSTPDAAGCQAFCREVRSQLAGPFDEWEAEEAIVAAVAGDAVLALLAAFKE